MKKWASAFVLCLFLAAWITAYPVSADVVVIDDHFESGSLSGWTATAGVGVVDGVTGANGKVVRVKDTGSGESNLIKSVPTLVGNVTAELRVMTDATDKEKRIHFSKNDPAGQKAFVYLKFTTTGKLTAQLSSGEVEILSSVTAGQWYSVKLDMNVMSGKYDVYVDGVLKASQVARNLSSATQIDYVNFKSRSGGALFVDDVKLYQTASVVAIDDRFESGSLSGWTATSGVGIVDGVTGANGKVVRVKDSGSGESNLIKSVPALVGNVTAELRVMTDATDKEKRIHFSKNDAGGQKAFVYLSFTNTGKLVAQLSNGEVEILSSVTPGQWYSLKLDMNVTSGKYDVYVDGVLKASQVSRNLSSATQIDYVNFKSRSGGALFVDDVKLYQPASPPELTTVPTFESASYYIPYANSSAQVGVYYRKVGETAWEQAYQPFYSASEKEFRGSIVSLQENTAYEVKAEITENGISAFTLTSTFTTWASDVPISQTIPVSQLYTGGQLLLDGMQGSETGWIKIVGDGTTIDVGTALDSSVLIRNSKYLMLENLDVRGGKQNGMTVTQSESIRIIGSEVSGWGRVGTFDPTKGYAVDETGAIIDFDAGIKVWDASKIVVERNYVHDPRGHSNSWYGPTWNNVHPHGPEAMNVKSGTGSGGIVIRYNDFIGSDDHRWNDAIGETANGFTYSGLSLDGDVYGNMLAFGNDDGIELDGGQKNLRFYHNKIEGFYSGISAAPDMQGPSYIFRNLIVSTGSVRLSKPAEGIRTRKGESMSCIIRSIHVGKASTASATAATPIGICFTRQRAIMSL